MTQIASEKITFPDKSLYIDKTPIEISQILSLSERKAEVLCGHVVKIHKNRPPGYSEMGLCFCIPSSQKEKKNLLLRGPQCLVSRGRGHWHLSAQRIPSSRLLCVAEKTCSGCKVQVNLPGLAFLYNTVSKPVS